MFKESSTIELKSQIVSDLPKEVIAFANSEGGIIYIGINDDGTIKGVDNGDQIILQANNMIRDNISPDITMFMRYETLIIENKNIVSIIIQEGTNKPYYLNSKGLKPSGVFIRNGTSCNPASDLAIRKMIKETDGDNFERMRSLEQSLTFNYTSEYFKKRNIIFNEQKMISLKMLSNDAIYSNTGYLLSDQYCISIKAATFIGTTKTNFLDRKEFSGPLFKQIEDVYEYLSLRNNKSTSFEGLYRKDTLDYPYEALREALLNSCVHRDYSLSAPTLISVFEDRIEFVSVGGLLNGISLEDIMLGLSICRNQDLANIFYRLELIEAYGTGIPKIMKAYEGCSMQPKFEVTNNAFKLTLPNKNYQKSRLIIDEHPIMTQEEELLKILNHLSSISRKDVEKSLGVSQATANRILKDMVNSSIIYPTGKGKNTRYKKSK